MQDDFAAIESICRAAFPDEDLMPVVEDLLREGQGVLSLVGEVDSRLVGHVIFTDCSVAGTSGKAALLGPLAVAPEWQRRGVGSAIVRAGFQRLRDAGVGRAFVLGDPAYYGRFGFLPESRVVPPYPLPDEWEGAWQSKALCDASTPPRGELSLPRPWLRPELWQP